MRKILLLLLSVIFIANVTYAQDGSTKQVTGKLLDAQTKEPLIGAVVSVKGTTQGSSVSLDGSFKIKVPADGSTTLEFRYIGYVSKELVVTQADLGKVMLDATSGSLKSVVITGDVAIDRKTPIAVTSINARTIEEKIGTQDLPLLLRSVPGVMATNTSGFGDSRVSIRGFKSTSKNGNVAMTINGIPVNDMENGQTYWSDFTGLSDVTTSFQVQRGLGAAKIIVPSFGGTINITTRNTDAEKGGYLFEGIGSDGYNKMGALVSTGLTKDGWAVTFQGSKTQGTYHADNTEYLNYNYFFNLSKVISPSQTLSFSVMGASQKHNTRYSSYIQTIRDAPNGTRYNPDAGVLNGEPYDPYQNYFSKPLASLNHSWVINEKSSLSTVVYATYGTGGGVSLVGTAPRINGGSTSIKTPTDTSYASNKPNGLYDYSPIDLTAVAKANAMSVDGSVTNYLRTAVNNHNWFGARSTYNTKLTDDINLSAGIDLKDYQGSHYEKVNNLLGGQYVMDGANKNDPTAHAVTGDKVGYYNVDDILSGGAFLQSEYSKDDLSAFVTLSGTESNYQRNDYFTYTPEEGQHSKRVNFFTYQAKGGANYNINDQMNVFANIGYITKPPYFDNVYLNNTNDINKSSVTEKLFSYELGYGYKASDFSANLNFYRSNYMDRAYTTYYLDPTTQTNFGINLSGINEMHEGAELELKLQPVKQVTINGSLSLGNWYYTKNGGKAQAFDDTNKPIGSPRDSTLIKGLKVGDAPQTQAHIGVDVDVLSDFRIGGDYYYNGNYTSDFNFYTIQSAGASIWKIPNYSTVDLNAVLKFKIAGLAASLTGNVYNLFNTKYISDALDGTTSKAPSGSPKYVTVFYGYGRNFGTSLKIKF